MRHLLWFIFIACLGCRENDRKPLHMENSKVEEIKLMHFERDLFALDTANLKFGLEELRKAYPKLSPLFFEQVAGMTDRFDSLDQNFYHELKLFLTDSSIRTIRNLVQNNFATTQSLEKELRESAGYMKHYFPSMLVPNFYTLISGFSVGNFIFEDADQKEGLGIGLDFFLGKEFDYKLLDPQNQMFSDYLTRCFNKEHLVKKTWEVWADDKLGPEPSNRFLDYIIHRGKKLYILSRLIPEIQDTVLFEFTPSQLKWCNENRTGIWSFFTAEQLLYNTSTLKFNKYVNPSPDSPGMPADAPGMTGCYIGFQIVEAFMNRSKSLSMEDLIKEKDSQKILDQSKFKPKSER